MSTVQETYDELATVNVANADQFKNEMIAAMMETETSFTAKGSAGLRGVAAAWASKRDFLKNMQDPAFRAMAANVVAEEYGVELPIEDELALLSTEADADGDSEDAETDGATAEPSFS